MTWNGTTVDGPVLIYHDELILINDTDVLTIITDPDGPGNLVCRSTQSITPSWRLTDASAVLSTGEGNTFRQIVEIETPFILSLLTRRVSQIRTDPLTNGLWFCDSGVMDTSRIHVGIFSRASGKVLA